MDTYVQTRLPAAPSGRRVNWLIVAITVVVGLLMAAVGFGGGYWSHAAAIDRANQATEQARATVADLRESLADTRAKLSTTQSDLVDERDSSAFWYGQDRLHKRGWECAKDLARAFKGSTFGYAYRALPILNGADCQKVSPGKWGIG